MSFSHKDEEKQVWQLTITKADTKHRGHEVSEVQFKKYRKKRPVASVQRNVLMPRQDKSWEVSEEEREPNQEQLLKDSPSKEQEGKADGVPGHAE